MSFEVRPTRVLTLGPSPNAFGALENHSLSRLGFLLQFGGYSSAHLVVSSLELKKSSQERADLAQQAGLRRGCLPGLGSGPRVQGVPPLLQAVVPPDPPLLP